ncbi:MAG: glycerophosphodiester phosphodiesterase [Firmicutes bacterium]|nr:glycerophosphodiester phosphodiesterase [Bacillota bacterium]
MAIAIAHRGDTRRATENTISAFLDAVAAGADWIELDVQATHDGQAIVLHDDSFARIWHVEQLVETLDWSDIARYFHGEVPRLQTVLESISCPVMVDFKSEGAVKPLVTAIHECRAWDRCLIVTGNVNALRSVQHLAPHSLRGLTWDHKQRPELDFVRNLGVRYFNPYWAFVTEELVDVMHRSDYLVSAWTVDDDHVMRHLIGLGVDAIVSNDVATLVSVSKTSDVNSSRAVDR